MDEITKRLAATAGPFSQVVAISQATINSSLFYLFRKHHELRTIHVKRPGIGELDAQMDTAKVVLPVKGQNYSTVVFLCHFKSGKLKFPGKEHNVDGWVFAFDVDYAILDVPRNSSEYKEVQKIANQPGDYSIKRLYLDFATNKIINFRENMSDFKGHAWEAEEKDFFLLLMRSWGSGSSSPMKNPQVTTLGYGLETDHPSSVNVPAPSFPPTALKHQIYKYIKPGNKEPEDGLEKGGKNVLLYVEMTQNKDWPQAGILPYSGNFVIDDIKATACISSQVFFDSYLLRNVPPEDNPKLPGLLQEFNRWLFFSVGNSVEDFNAYLADGEWRLRFSFAIGPKNQHHQYPFEEVKKDPNFFAWKRESDTEWKFEKRVTRNLESGVRGSSSHCTAKLEATTTNKITITPGTNKIALSGRSYMFLDFSAKNGGHSFQKRGGLEITWETTATLKSVHQGGLQIDLNTPDNFEDWIHVRYLKAPEGSSNTTSPEDDMYAAADEAKWKMIENVEEAAKDQLKKIKEKLTPMTTNLRTALGTTSKYVLSGEQTFLYKNPIFGNKGDLLVEATYDN